MALCREFDSRHIISSSLHNLGFVALEHGDDVRAMAYFSESLEIARQQSDPEEIGGSLAGLAGVAAARGQFERAARLFGAMDALRAANVSDLHPANQLVSDRSIAAARAQLSDDSFAAAWAAGQAMRLEQAIAEALDR